MWSFPDSEWAATMFFTRFDRGGTERGVVTGGGGGMLILVPEGVSSEEADASFGLTDSGRPAMQNVQKGMKAA